MCLLFHSKHLHAYKECFLISACVATYVGFSRRQVCDPGLYSK